MYHHHNNQYNHKHHNFNYICTKRMPIQHGHICNESIYHIRLSFRKYYIRFWL